MKSLTSLKRVPARLTALALAAIWISSTAGAHAQALQGQLQLRPLTPQEKKDYSLSTAQGASGLSTVGLGQPAYLDALINSAVLNENITNIEWKLTRPVGSMAELRESILGTNVPPYKMADLRYSAKVATRRMLLPDVAGHYTVSVTIATKTSGTTNLTQNVTASTYTGVETCRLCHDGSSGIPAKYAEWAQTPHATFFTRQIDGGVDPATSHYSKNCISCHTVGYDTATNAVNGGFDDVAAQLGWVFPPVLTNGNWAAMPSQLKNLANIQCENCHGPGLAHAVAELSNPHSPEAGDAIAVSFIAGNCAQCHDSKPNHVRSAEWNNSRHAVATRSPSGPSRAACARCHTAAGFAAYTETLDGSEPWTGTNVAYTSYEVITCAACHDPHSDSNPHQLRTAESIALADGPNIATITTAGAGTLCMNCHQSRSGSYTNSLIGYPQGKPTYAGGSSSFGPHDNPAADMLMGVNGYTYGKDIPSSAHRFAVEDTCAGCHMQEVTSSNPVFTKAGGHTFSMVGTVVTNGMTNTIELVEVCIKCHGEMESFNLVKSDYNGDGIIEGVQDEVQKLLDTLSTMLPPRNSPNVPSADPASYKADGKVKTSFGIYTNTPIRFLQAMWNWQLVNNDLSKGIHNSKYAVGLLKASIADLSGDANNDGLADWWQQTYFGDINSPSAAPNASPAGDNIPNWLKFALGLDPREKVTTLDTSGFVYANGKSIGGGTNTLHIYTAAEVSFDTETNKTYQIQGISNLGGGWQDIGAPIPGTGAAISYVTPTRGNVQQFYRVITQ